MRHPAKKALINPQRRFVYLRLSIVIMMWCIGVSMGMPEAVSAAPLQFHEQYNIFFIDPSDHPQWKGTEQIWIHAGQRVAVPQRWRAEGDGSLSLPEGIEWSSAPMWNREAIRATLLQSIIPLVERTPGTVRIFRTTKGKIAFEGVGIPGRHVDVDTLTDLVVLALEEGVSHIMLPVQEVPPTVVVDDTELIAQGIRELVAFGESNFASSPENRSHNIAIGLKKFQGVLIPPSKTFSFNAVLGEVNEETGYRKELTILGEKTLPDFGGGLCQVSTTLYRAAWSAGFPMTQRRNHSYVVRYYAPVGTDATIYPPFIDMRFTNDTDAHLLMQTFTDGKNAFFLLYGSHDDRKSELMGPFVWEREEPPPERTEYTMELEPGVIRKVGEAVPGMQVMWYRIVQKGESVKTEDAFSLYEARPLFHQIGVSSLPVTETPKQQSNVVAGTSVPPSSAESSALSLPAVRGARSLPAQER